MTTDERLMRVENQLARTRSLNSILIVCVVLCLMLCILLSLGGWFILRTCRPQTARARPGAEEIRASRFVVEDKDRRGTAVLAQFGEAGPGLVLADAQNTPRLSVMLDRGMPSMQFRDENGACRAELGLSKPGPILALNDPNGIHLVECSIRERNAGLTLLDKKGQARATLDVTSAGFWTIPALTLWDKNGRPHITLSMTEEPSLILYNENGQPSALLTHVKERPVLMLYGAGGQEIWSAP